MNMKLRNKLSLSYIFIVVLCIILISVMSNIFLKRMFEDYVIKSIESKSKDIISSIEKQYKTRNGWNKDVIQNIGIDALEEGLIIEVKDFSDRVIWDATEYNNKECDSLIDKMSENMSKLYHDWQGGYTENTYNVKVDSRNVGTVKIGYYGPFYYNDNDVRFLNTLNKIFIMVGIVSMIFAFIIAFLMAAGISRPISRVINTAENISRGEFEDRSNEKSNIKEINSLIITVNNLAKTLQEHENMQKRLTADVSHELRTPLTTLQSHLEAIIDGVWDPTVERIKSCHEEIIRINRLVGDLEKLSEYENHLSIINKSKFDVYELINNIIMNFENEYLIKDVHISFQGHKENIYADRDKISQLVVNLLSNALKYTPKGGTVQIKLKKLSNFIEIDVIDDGIGICKDDLPYIFERFYRADKSRNRLTGGAGVGLAIVKAIVEAHEGEITVESELNKGSKFIVKLPK